MKARWMAFKLESLNNPGETKIVRMKAQSMESMISLFDSSYPGWTMLGVSVEQLDGTYDTFRRIENGFVRVNT